MNPSLDFLFNALMVVTLAVIMAAGHDFGFRSPFRWVHAGTVSSMAIFVGLAHLNYSLLVDSSRHGAEKYGITQEYFPKDYTLWLVAGVVAFLVCGALGHLRYRRLEPAIK